MARGLCKPFDLDGVSRGPPDPGLFRQRAQQFRGARILRGVAAELAPPPRPQPAEPGADPSPRSEPVAGFVFKVQANIDPQHRDRIAFVRLCSGRFQRGMKLKNVRTGRLMSVQNPVFFLARERNLAEEAWPGDIIGIPNHGTLRIGDTLTEGADIRVTGMPSFAPEILRRVRIEDPMRSKHLRHALEQLAEEGVTRVFKPSTAATGSSASSAPCSSTCCRRGSTPNTASPPGSTARPYEAARWLDADARRARPLPRPQRQRLCRGP